MMYSIALTGKFKKSLKSAKKRGLNIDLLNVVADDLANDMPLNSKYRDHGLQGKYVGFRECHI